MLGKGIAWTGRKNPMYAFCFIAIRRLTGIQALKEFSKKEIYDLDDKDVLEYLMFKDVNDSVRTIIHHYACPTVGNASLQTCPDLVKCSLRHLANSMRIGIVLKLSKAFEEVGRSGAYVW